MTAPSAVLPLRRNKDFRLLWSAYTVTTVGSQVSVLALPSRRSWCSTPEPSNWVC